MEKKRLSFVVTGEFITKIARQWLWLEGKPWSTVEKFLLDCMCGTDKTREELVELATKVVIGRAKFIGNTGDGSYTMVEDDHDLAGKYIDQWNKEVMNLKKELREIEDKYYTLTNYLIDTGKGHLLAKAGVQEGIDGEDGAEADMLNDYLIQRELEREGHKDNYGWLDPMGNFYPVKFADHQSWAWKKAKELGFVKRGELNTGRSGDLLIDHGWALLHNPGLGVAFVTSSETKPLTKAQKEFLFGYYADRDLWEKAEQYLEE